VYVDVTLTRPNVKVKVADLLKFRKSPRWPRLQPCDCDCRWAVTSRACWRRWPSAPLRGFLFQSPYTCLKQVNTDLSVTYKMLTTAQPIFLCKSSLFSPSFVITISPPLIVNVIIVLRIYHAVHETQSCEIRRWQLTANRRNICYMWQLIYL